MNGTAIAERPVNAAEQPVAMRHAFGADAYASRRGAPVALGLDQVAGTPRAYGVTVTSGERIARRRAALTALDPLVRRQIPGLWPAPALAQVDLTIYDLIFPAAVDTGGHWTATVAFFGVFAHAVLSYTVALVFDEADQPHHFAISGARTITTADTSAAALAAGIAAAAAAGPLLTGAWNAYVNVGI